MMQSKTQWRFTAQELIYHMEISGIGRGGLCLLPETPEDAPKTCRDTVAQKRSEMVPEDLRLLERCIGILADPDRLLHVHINLGDGVVSRLSLGHAQSSPGMWAGLRHEGDTHSILLHADSELKYGIIDSLAAQTQLGETQVGCDLSTPAALAFLAVLDQYKRAHMLSMLNHVEPISVFSREDIEQRLAGSHIQDFRWLLPFTDKLMPLGINQLEVSGDAGEALAELAALEIIGKMDEESRLFDLEAVTLSIAEGYRRTISVAGIGHTARIPTGELLHDVFMLIRTPGDLLLTVMSGGQASLVGISAEELQNLLDSLLTISPSEENQGEEQAPVAAADTGEMTDADKAANPERFCKACGAVAAAGAKFCRSCGGRL